MPAPSLVAEHRQAVADVSDLVARDLRAAWSALDLTDAVAATDALLDVVPPLVDAYSEAVATLSADFYDDVRADAGVTGRFRAIPSEPPDTARSRALVRWGVDPLFGGAGPESAWTLLNGGLQRLVLASDRDTVRGSVAADPKAHGWQRFAKPGACKFCLMLQGRGNVYSPDTARFGAHDHCHCVAGPAFSKGEPVTVEQYVATKKRVTDADRARVRAFMAEMTGP